MEEQNLSNQGNQTSQAGPTLVDMQRFQKKKSRNGKKILIILILVAIISAAVYYFFFFNKNNAEPIAPKNNSNVSENENNIDKNLDTDSDGLPDYMEKFIGTNPNNSDSDGDGYDDLEEIKNRYSVSKNENKVENKIDKNLDTDQDKLPDYMEKILGTAVDNQDTDGDSYSDFDEIKNGYNPLNSWR